MTETERDSDGSGIPKTLGDELLRTLVDSVQEYAILALDPQGQILTWNAGAEKIKGYTAAEIVGSHFSRFYPDAEVARGKPELALQVARAEGRFEDEGWRVRKDGSTFWANVVITRLLDSRGQLLGFGKVTRDLSVRRQQEESLKTSEERFRTLVEGVKDYAIFMLDPKGLVMSWNSGARHIKGYEPSEIIGSHFSRFYPPEAIKRGLPDAELRGATLDGRFEDEGWRLRKDGSRFWANVIITAVRDATGRLTGFSKITRNLTARRRHEDDLRISEERFRLLVDGVTEYAIMMLDQDGFVSSWNVGAERIKGYQSHEILGKHVSHFYPSEAILANKPWADLATAREKGRLQDEGWRVRKDGTLFWASTVITVLRDGEGNPYGFAKVTQDLTQRRHAEALADTAQRMHEFIAMLAHELRNPLAPIRNAVALMGRKGGLSDPTLESMRQTIDRQSVLLTRLLDELLDVNRIARGQFAIEREPVDLQDVLTRSVEASRPLLDTHGHTIELALPNDPLPVLGDMVRLTQAVVNLLNNAAKYTPPGGRIRLSAGSRGAEIEIRVRDNGLGIERDMLEKVFDLFVQLEPANIAMGGLGVGLALVRRVVELHGGSVQARSEGKGRGSEFIVRLPRSIRQLRMMKPETRAGEGSIHRKRVLVVDDNKDAADSLKLLLESMGQDVCTVYDGGAAVLAAKTFQPDLVLMDIGMPHMSGYEVARVLRTNKELPPMTLVAVTGWGQEADKQKALESGFHHHCVKPMSEATLRAILLDVQRRTRAEISGPG
jgi:PAS domain S-box-containing protein